MEDQDIRLLKKVRTFINVNTVGPRTLELLQEIDSTIDNSFEARFGRTAEVVLNHALGIQTTYQRWLASPIAIERGGPFTHADLLSAYRGHIRAMSTACDLLEKIGNREI
jgi:hypothetical protein